VAGATEENRMHKLGLVIALSLVSSVTFADDAKLKQAPPPAADPAPAPAPAPTPTPTPPPTPPAASNATAEVKVGTGVEKRAIVGEATSFPAGTTVWVWSLVTNGEGAVKHVWKRDGKDVWTATLKVGSKKWSTQSRRTIPKPGAWEVDVQTADGTSLGTVAFKIE